MNYVNYIVSFIVLLLDGIGKYLLCYMDGFLRVK